MADESLTLQETADRLGVHYMTAYRWVRTGLLPAVKDNGVWRVRAEDADARVTAPEPDAEPRARRRVDHGERLAGRLLDGDRGGAVKLIDDALAGGLSAEDLCLNVITDALRQVGDAWESGEATVAEEHQASAIANELIGRLQPQFNRRGRKRGTIVLGTVADDFHALPVALLAGPVRGRGHRVVELGANTPPQAFVDAIGLAETVEAVGIFTAFHQAGVVADTVAALRGVAPPPTRIVVGGAGVRDEPHADDGDVYVVTSDGLEALDALTGSV